MKTRRWMRYLATIMALTLVMSTPLQASEFALEGETEAVPTAALDGAVAEDEILLEEELLSGETDQAEVAPVQSAAPVAEIPEEDTTLEVTEISEVASYGADGTTTGTTTSTFRTGIWLHVVNGNFSGTYKDKDIGEKASVWVQAQCLNQLPDDVNGITVTRSNGIFDGWYTEAPTEELQPKEGGYSVWRTVRTNGTKIEPGDAIPEGVHVLYAAFKDKDVEKEEVEDADKLVTFYLDWNGINGLYGHCLSCTRSYKKGNASFTAEDAAVYGLNFKPEYESAFESSEDKWSFLKMKWSEDEFDGYTFKGWSTTPTVDTGEIWTDTTIENGASFYAVWEKGEESNKTFYDTKENKPKDPLDGIRIMPGDGTTFTSGTLSSSKDAKVGESFKLKLFCTPIGAEKKDVTWTLKVTKGVKSLAELFKQSAETMTITVNADGTSSLEGSIEGLEVKAEGETLTITNKGHESGSGGKVGEVCSIDVSATAKSSEDKVISSNASATLSFAHAWNAGEQSGEATCVSGATITYTCACGETKVESIPPLGHVYDNRNPDNMDYGEYRNCNILKAPTCTEAGAKELKCLRCDAVKDSPVQISPLGHDWSEEERTPATCNQDTITKHCMREGCTVQETSLVPSNEIHSELHSWTETRRDQISCMEDRVYERCAYCGETRNYKAPAKNPHSYEYKSRMSVNCQWVIYAFKCVHCGSIKEMLKKEENHEWSDWTTSASLNSETGMMERKRTRTCTRCDEEETEDLGDVVASQPKTEPESELETEPEPESKTKPESELETGPEPESKTGPEPEPETEPESESGQHTELSAEQVTSPADSNLSATPGAPEMSAPTSNETELSATEPGETDSGETESGETESAETELSETELSETEPSTPEMSTPASNATEPDAAEPSAPKMNVPASNAAEPSVTEPEVTESEVTEPGETEPGTSEMSAPTPNAAPSVAEPDADAAEADAIESGTPEMSTLAPHETEPGVTEPNAAAPDVAESDTPEMSTPVPHETEPGVTEPDAAESGATEPGTPTTYVQTSGIAAVSAPAISAPVVSRDDSAVESGWQKVGKKKYYYVDGVKQTGWKKIGKKMYYFSKNGVMQTGWKKIGKKKYYFGKNGVMRTGKQKTGKKN